MVRLVELIKPAWLALGATSEAPVYGGFILHFPDIWRARLFNGVLAKFGCGEFLAKTLPYLGNLEISAWDREHSILEA